MAYQHFFSLLSATLDEMLLEVAMMLGWWGICNSNSQLQCNVKRVVFECGTLHAM